MNTQHTASTIWEQFGDMIHNIAWKQKDRHAGISHEELVSDAFYEVLLRLPRYNPDRGALSTFVYQNAYYALLTRACKEKREWCDSELMGADDGSIFDQQEARESFLVRARKHLTEEAFEIVQAVADVPWELADELSLRAPVRSRRALHHYMRSEKGWNKKQWATNQLEVGEFLHEL
jgi:hypothetical protein